ncbi:MAG: hypothetical protein NTW87_01595 [Planctomycetota bacterium]|nr:hypothetical protein [Planctomycetota bacterium]
MTLVAGALVGMSLHRWPNNVAEVTGIYWWGGAENFANGWPFRAYWHWGKSVDLLDGVVSGEWSEWDYTALAGNVLVALAIIVACGVVCEWRIRRRSRTPRSSFYVV